MRTRSPRRRPRRWLAALVVAASLALVPIAAAATSRQGWWEGTTSQEEAIRFKVNGDQLITDIKTVVKIRTPSCVRTLTWVGYDLSVPIRKDGTFRIKLVNPDDEDDTLTVAGQFTAPRRVGGTLRAVESEEGCGHGSANVRWKATRP